MRIGEARQRDVKPSKAMGVGRDRRLAQIVPGQIKSDQLKSGVFRVFCGGARPTRAYRFGPRFSHTAPLPIWWRRICQPGFWLCVSAYPGGVVSSPRDTGAGSMGLRRRPRAGDARRQRVVAVLRHRSRYRDFESFGSQAMCAVLCVFR